MADTFVKFLFGASAPASLNEGSLYFVSGDESIRLKMGEEEIRIGGIERITLAELNAKTEHNANRFYYVTDRNALCVYDEVSQGYVQFNIDTGATAVALTGAGNAVTSASYDAETRTITLIKGETFATSAELTAADTAIRAYVDEKTKGIATDAALGELQDNVDGLAERIGTAEGEIDALQEASAKHVEKVDGKSLIADTEIARLAAMSDGANKVEASETNGNIKIDSVETVVYTHPEKHAIADVDGLQDALDGKQAVGDYATKAEAQAMADGKDEAIAAAKKSGDDAMAEAQKKVASVGAGDASVTVAGTSTAPTVAVKLDPAADNAIKLGENGLKVEIGAAPEYTIVKAENSGEYAAVYNLTKDGTIVGASINIPKDLVVKSGSVVGDEIVLVLNDEAATEIKIPVASLIEYVTSGSQAGDMVVVNVSDDHKVTATITDGAITLAKLATDVQTAIGKAHSHENADVLAGITADDVANWNGAQAAAEKTAADALAAAKGELEDDIADVDAKFADYTNTTDMNAAIKAVDDKFASYSTTEQMNAAIKVVDDKFADYSTTEQMNAAIKVETDRAVLAEEALAGRATTLEGEMDAAEGRLDALEAIDHDAYIAADETVLTSAKEYTDSMLVWGSF